MLAFTNERYKKQLLTSSISNGKSLNPDDIKSSFDQMTYGLFIDLHRNCSLEPVECKTNRRRNIGCRLFSGTGKILFKAPSTTSLKGASIQRRFKKEKSKIHDIWPLYRRGFTQRFSDSFKEETTDSASSENSMPLSVLKKRVTEEQKRGKKAQLCPRRNAPRRRRNKFLRKSLDSDNTSISSTKKRKNASTNVSTPTGKIQTEQTSTNSTTPPTYTLQNLLQLMVDGSNNSAAFKESEIYRRYVKILPTAENEHGSLLIKLPKLVKYKCTLDLSTMYNLTDVMLVPELQKNEEQFQKYSKQIPQLETYGEQVGKEPNNNKNEALEKSKARQEEKQQVTQQASETRLSSQSGAVTPEIVVPENSTSIRATLRYDKLAAPCILLPASMYPLYCNRPPSWTCNADGAFEPPVPMRITSLNGKYDQTHFFNIPMQHNDEAQKEEQKAQKPAKNKPKSRKPRATKNKDSNDTTKKVSKKSRQIKPKAVPLKQPTVVKCRPSKKAVANTTKTESNNALPTEGMIAEHASYMAALDMPVINDDLNNRGPESNNSQQTQPSSGARSSADNLTPSYQPEFKGFNCSEGNMNLASASRSPELFAGFDFEPNTHNDLLERFAAGEVGDTIRDYSNDFPIDNEMSSTPIHEKQFIVQMAELTFNNEKDAAAKVLMTPLDFSNFEYNEQNEANVDQQPQQQTNDATLVGNNSMPSNDIGTVKMKTCESTNNLSATSNNSKSTVTTKNDSNQTNILKNLSNLQISKGQCRQQRRSLSQDSISSNLAKRLRLSRDTRKSMPGLSSKEEAAATSEQLNDQKPTTLAEDEYCLQLAATHIPDKPPLQLLSSDPPCLGRQQNTALQRHDVKVISNQILRLPSAYASKQPYQEKFVNNIFQDKGATPSNNLTGKILTPCAQRSELKKSIPAAAINEPKRFLLPANVNNATTLARPVEMFKIEGGPSATNSASFSASDSPHLPTGLAIQKTVGLNKGSNVARQLSSQQPRPLKVLSNPNSLFGNALKTTFKYTDNTAKHNECAVITVPPGNTMKGSKSIALVPNQSCISTNTAIPVEVTDATKDVTQTVVAKTEKIENDNKKVPLELDTSDKNCIFLAPLELDQQYIDCLDFEDDGVESTHSENDYLAPCLKAESEVLAELSKRNEENDDNGQYNGVRPQKISMRRKSEGFALKQKIRCSRYSVDLVTKDAIYLSKAEDCEQDSAAATQTVTRTVQQQHQPLQHQPVHAVSNKPIFIEVPADPPPLNTEEKNGFKKMFEITDMKIIKPQSNYTGDLRTEGLLPFKRRNSRTLHTTQKWYKNESDDVIIELPCQPAANKHVCGETRQTSKKLLPDTEKMIVDYDDENDNDSGGDDVKDHLNDMEEQMSEDQQIECKEKYAPNIDGTQIYKNLSSRNHDAFDVLKFFNIQCVAALNDVRNCCSQRPHAPLRDKLSVEAALSTLPRAQAHQAYAFARKRVKLFCLYFEAFVSYFAKAKSINGLRRLLHDGDGGYFEYFTINMLQSVYQSLKKCGLTNEATCKLILTETKQRTSFMINGLLEIIFDCDWTLFADSIKALVAHPAAVLTIDILEKMSEQLMDNYDVQFATIFFQCLMKTDAEYIQRIFKNRNLYSLFNDMYASLHN